MNKKLVSALTTALVVGAASTTFAASNPFSDVPADHWAYDAVTQLANDGVIEGYGDSTFKGNRNITRYEMAQMVAKAMTKSTSGVDKALVDKLAAEFAEELNNLGVRVANLERNADKVQWHGTAEYTFQHYMTEGQHDTDKNSRNNLLIRLEPTAEVNSHWHVKARLDANTFLDEDSSANAEDEGKVALKRVYAEGNYGNWTLKFGKFATPDDDTIADTAFSGAEVAYKPAGDGVNFVVGAGRLNSPAAFNREKNADADDLAANYQYVGVGAQKSKLWGAVRWHHLNARNFENLNYNLYAKNKTDEANVVLVKGGYNFSKNVGLKGFYAQNHDADYYKKAGSVELDYKGAQAENQGTWGAWVAYRHFGRNAFVASPWDVINIDNMGEKGWEVGGNYAVFKNTILTLRYGNGKDLKTDKKVENLFGRVNFLF
ncbi:putative major envelope protein [Selenomonas ruminantium subsp. lactilytica TAM6421]|uniref:Putative major envelope protein n=1 Tax=Selenomonas ruminantium subsp. lactilytica (strain NBRC 103574 / TAM6421) TaxID=927704 RepID=I0GMW7_SELRL|nr:putative porin [Selenomonas ruminantium]BAL82104.1 putative major envelope protein [Selenomonas ruminantium subsp. lactilytica TAM6421]